MKDTTIAASLVALQELLKQAPQPSAESTPIVLLLKEVPPDYVVDEVRQMTMGAYYNLNGQARAQDIGMSVPECIVELRKKGFTVTSIISKPIQIMGGHVWLTIVTLMKFAE